jgi:hypothetical protein
MVINLYRSIDKIYSTQAWTTATEFPLLAALMLKTSMVRHEVLLKL